MATVWLDTLKERADLVAAFFLGADGKPATSTNPAPMAGVPSKVASGQFNRPADTSAYAVGDLIANNTTAGSVAALVLDVGRAAGIPFVGRRVRLKSDDTAFKNATIRVHLFRNQPTPTVGDNGVFNTSETYAVPENDYIGYVDVTLSQQFSDGMVKGFASVDFISSPVGTTIWALLETRTAVTPQSAKLFHLTLEALRD